MLFLTKLLYVIYIFSLLHQKVETQNDISILGVLEEGRQRSAWRYAAFPSPQ